MSHREIRFTQDDEPIKMWCAALDDADSLERLKDVVVEWEAWCGDAYDAVMTWGDDDFARWRLCLATERQRKCMGMDCVARNQGVLVGSEVLMRVGVTAAQYQVPFTLMRRQMMAGRFLGLRAGRYVLTEQIPRT